MNSDALRKNWKALSENARLFFEILYEEQGYVSEQELSKKLSTNPEDLSKILGWIGRTFESAGVRQHYWWTYFEQDEGKYRLADRYRPVVGELLGYHGEERTILLDTLWAMQDMFHSIASHFRNFSNEDVAGHLYELEQNEREVNYLLHKLSNFRHQSPPEKESTPQIGDCHNEPREIP